MNDIPKDMYVFFPEEDDVEEARYSVDVYYYDKLKKQSFSIRFHFNVTQLLIFLEDEAESALTLLKSLPDLILHLFYSVEDFDVDQVRYNYSKVDISVLN